MGITQLLFLWIADLREIYAKLFKKNYRLFLWIADLSEIYAKLFRKNYKLFLQIVDLRERYAKLFTNVRDRTYQNADANGCNGSEAQRTNADNI